MASAILNGSIPLEIAGTLLTLDSSCGDQYTMTTLHITCTLHDIAIASGVAKGRPSRARPDQSSAVPYQMMLNYLPLYTLNIRTYR